jgi:uncharacterized protein (DUF58 family)
VNRADIIRKIATFPLKSAALAEDILSGGFRSVFKGNGIEFDEVRRYEPGDDVRSIDRNVSARFGTPYIKLYREDHELCVCIIIDCSASMFAGGSARQSRYEQAVLAAALIAFSAERSGQRLCGLFFDNEPRVVFKPQRGRAHTMAMLSAALAARPADSGTSLAAAIKCANNILKRRSLVVLISDFLSVEWERDFGALCSKHDCIAIRIKDPIEENFPSAGLIPIMDAETSASVLAASNSLSWRLSWQDWHKERRQLWAAICKAQGAAEVEISTDEDTALSLQRFFRSRRFR